MLLVLIILLSTCLIINLISKSRKPLKRVIVVVFGDIGRSPRIQYHSISLLKLEYQIDLIGYTTSPIMKLLQSPFVKIKSLSPPNKLPKNIIFYLTFAILRIIYQSLEFTYFLFSCQKPAFILVQNRIHFIINT